ncbi:MAG: lysophospholipid acyltransferase family protein [Candidatus Devosia phytovorans]|uniref:Lysophospholipid acyltransferase family protein n=1 Tax=Candidatus Devosia phytovorans TaxID=3121372 RepID=A0AAJ5VSN0_9HYPH|nr:lysophospholipid acyltransferase family protein [Devosia sp.]WEK04091.1 MAG: lysophospholipid acyltransferase family protein [Devosia sp.]
MIFRVPFFIFVFVPFLIIAIPAQAVILALKLPFWHVVPRLFHRVGCTFLGLRVRVIGAPATGRPTLLTANHTSWTDIIAIGAVANVAFVAKSEIAKWPFVSMMANLQKTIYVDRTRRAGTGKTAKAMGKLMADGTAVVLFAEGQSNIGPHLLPFRSALIGAAQHAMVEAGATDVNIQPLAIAYTRLQGLPVSRNERSLVAWVRSKSLKQNIREILGGPVKDVVVSFGEPLPLSGQGNRKQVSKAAEDDVRAMLVALNRGHARPLKS